MIITYNDKEYNIPTFIDQILERDDLLAIPLNIWANVFEEQFGYKNFPYLLKILKKQIDKFDKEHKSFTFKGKNLWWEKDTRNSLYNLANTDIDIIQIVAEEAIFDVTKEDLKNILNNVEIYASKVFILTQKHLLAVNLLQTVDDLLNYDYTLEYPDKVVIE